MRMDGFKDLLKDMYKKEKDQEQFRFRYNNVEFDTIFRINTTPYELLIGAIGHTFSMILSMNKGYIVNIPDDDFYKLCELLNIQASKNGSFNSQIFLKYVSDNAPKLCNDKIVQPHHVARYKKKELRAVDDSEKIYFVGWNNHLKDERTARNIEKTRILLGDETADYCKKYNISSCWSDKPKEAGAYKKPWE